jgi:circadian clock protein KaiB
MSKEAQFKFRLFIAGNAQNSAQALANLNALCTTYLPGRHHIQVVDVYREPKLALAEHVIMTPTLVRLSPLPVIRVVGTLGQFTPILQALGLDVVAS